MLQPCATDLHFAQRRRWQELKKQTTINAPKAESAQCQKGVAIAIAIIAITTTSVSTSIIVLPVYRHQKQNRHCFCQSNCYHNHDLYGHTHLNESSDPWKIWPWMPLPLKIWIRYNRCHYCCRRHDKAKQYCERQQ